MSSLRTVLIPKSHVSTLLKHLKFILHINIILKHGIFFIYFQIEQMAIDLLLTENPLLTADFEHIQNVTWWWNDE